ncbi:hypothetical protein Tco_1507891 [Tanacetum coccineum]
MEANLAPKPSVQVNKVTSSCEICIGPHETQYCMENPKQAFVDYASSRTDKVGDLRFTTDQDQKTSTNPPTLGRINQTSVGHKLKPSQVRKTARFPPVPLATKTNLEKALSNFDSYQERRLFSLGSQLKQQQDDVISKISALWKVVSKTFDNASTHDTAGNSMANMNAISTKHLKEGAP